MVVHVCERARASGARSVAVATDDARIAQEIERINAFRRVRIHCIGIGEHDASLLSRLASRTGGSYVTLD